jgi:hypothetical protein
MWAARLITIIKEVVGLGFTVEVLGIRTRREVAVGLR